MITGNMDGDANGLYVSLTRQTFGGRIYELKLPPTAK